MPLPTKPDSNGKPASEQSECGFGMNPEISGQVNGLNLNNSNKLLFK